MPKITINVVIDMPKIPMTRPKISNSPSLLSNPRDIIKIEIPGKRLVNGKGTNIDRAKIKDKKPIILS